MQVESSPQAPGICSKSRLGMEHPGHPLLLLVLLPPLPEYTQRSPLIFGLGLQDRCFLSLSRKRNNALHYSLKCSFRVFLGKGGRRGRRERRNGGDRCERPQETAVVYAGDDALGRDDAGCPLCRSISPGAAPRPGPGRTGAGNGTRPPPSGTKAPRDAQSPKNTRPSRRQDEKWGFPLSASRSGMERTLPRGVP